MWREGEIVADLYEIRGVNTEGGMAVVYFAWHRGWRLELVIKSPRPEILADRTARARFVQEAETWVNLGLHPNIVTAYYVRQIEDFPRIIMEKMSGGSLKAALAARRVTDLATALDLAIQIAAGLAYAQKRSPGFVHRDLKPANVLLTPAGEARVTDFGLAGAVGARVGTPAYMAPEVWTDPARVTPAADLYSFGILLYELLTGRRPFDRGDVGTSLGQIAGGRGVEGSLGHLRAPLEEVVVADDVTLGVRMDVQRVTDRSLGEVDGDDHLARLSDEELEFYRETSVERTPDPPDRFTRGLPPRLSDLSLALLAKRPSERPRSASDVAALLRSIYEDAVGGPYPREEPRDAELVADALNNRALSYLDLHAERQAVQAWQEALVGNPAHFESNVNLGYWQWSKGLIDDLSCLRRLEEFAPAHGARPEYWQALAGVHLDRGDHEGAGEAMRHLPLREGDAESSTNRPLPDLPYAALVQTETLPDPIHDVVCSRTGAALLVAGKNGLLKLLETDSLLCMQTYEDSGVYEHSTAAFWKDVVVVAGTHGYDVLGWKLDGPQPWTKLKANRPADSKAVCESASALAISKDGARLVAAYRFGMGTYEYQPIIVFDTESGTSVHTLKGHMTTVEAICLTDDDRRLVSAGPVIEEDPIKLWDIETEQCLGGFAGHLHGVFALAVSAGDRYLLSGGGSGEMKLWNLHTRECIRTYEGHTGDVYAVAFAADEDFLLSAGQDGTIRIWHRDSGRCIRTLTGHTDSVYSVSRHPRGDRIFSGSKDRTLRAWSLRPAIGSHFSYVLSRPRGARELLTSAQTMRKLVAEARQRLDAGACREAYELFRQAQRIEGFDRHPDVLSGILACARHGRRSAFRGATAVAELAHDDCVTALQFSPDGRRVASGSKDGRLRVWDLELARCERTLGDHPCAVSGVAWTPDSAFVVSACRSSTFTSERTHNTLRLWDISSGRCVNTFGDFKGSLGCASVIGDGAVIVTGDWGERDRHGEKENLLRLWDRRSGASLHTWQGHEDAMAAIDVSPDGRHVASAGRDGTIRIWDDTQPDPVCTIAAHGGTAFSVKFSPDGSRLLSGGGDDLVKLWDARSGHCLRELRGHADTVHDVAFADDRFALSCGEDRQIIVWALDSGSLVRSLEGHTDGIVALACSADGRYAASGGYDKIARLWDLDWDWEFSGCRD